MAAPNPPARLNRSLIALAGVVLLAVAAIAGAVHFGRLPLAAPSDPLFTAPTTAPSWWAWLAAAAGVVLALAALRWLLAQARRRPSPATWRWDSSTGSGRSGAAGQVGVPGRTEMVSSAAAEPLIADIRTHRTVHDASVRLTGHAERPRLDLEVAVDDDDADLAAVRAHLEHHALPRLRTALEARDLDAHVLLRVEPTSTGRVQ